jgi:transcriptional regulator with PAS, ATPase and Fis domain
MKFRIIKRHDWNIDDFRKRQLDDVLKLIGKKLSCMTPEAFGYHLIFVGYLNAYLGKSEDEVLTQMLQLNRKYNTPIPEYQIVNVSKGIVNDLERYYEVDLLVSLLEISDEDQKNLSVLISKKERSRRFDEKRTKASELRKFMNEYTTVATISICLEKGMTKKQIADYLKISRRSVYNYIKKLNKYPTLTSTDEK